MRTEILNQNEDGQIERAADLITAGEIIGIYFNGTYAFLCALNAEQAADTIFRIKGRPRSKTLALVTSPESYWQFIDHRSEGYRRFPPARIAKLYTNVHALGIVYPADPAAGPAPNVQNGTLLNVWSEYPLLRQLDAACQKRGVPALQGASSNPSGEPTYTRSDQMLARFKNQFAAMFQHDEAVPLIRRKSTSLVDFTGPAPTLIREGNVPELELRIALKAAGLGKLSVTDQIQRLE